MLFYKEIKALLITFKIFIKKQMIFRVNFFTPYFFKLFQLITSIVVWNAIFQNKEIIRGYSFKEMVSYLIFAQFAMITLTPSHINFLQQLVRKGELSAYLLRPSSLVTHFAGRFLATKIPHILFFVFVGMLFLDKSFISFNYLSLMIFLLSLTLSFSLGFSLSCFSFFLVETWPINHLFYSLMAILGGVIVPLDLLPDFMRFWAPFTPFAYLSYVNVKIFQGEIKSSLLFIHFFNVVFLNILFFAIGFLMYRRGLKRYEAVGC